MQLRIWCEGDLTTPLVSLPVGSFLDWRLGAGCCHLQGTDKSSGHLSALLLVPFRTTYLYFILIHSKYYSFHLLLQRHFLCACVCGGRFGRDIKLGTIPSSVHRNHSWSGAHVIDKALACNGGAPAHWDISWAPLFLTGHHFKVFSMTCRHVRHMVIVLHMWSEDLKQKAVIWPTSWVYSKTTKRQFGKWSHMWRNAGISPTPIYTDIYFRRVIYGQKRNHGFSPSEVGKQHYFMSEPIVLLQ